MDVERNIQNVQISYEELLKLVQKAFPDCTGIDDWKLLSGGALNTAYKFQIGEHAFVLRIYLRDRAHCKLEKSIHQLIEKHVSTPKLIYADESHQPWAYTIFEFVEGVQLSLVPDQQKSTLSYNLGQMLSSIHAFKFPQAGLIGDGLTISHPFQKGSSPYFEEAVSVLTKGVFAKARLGEKLADTTLAFMEKNKHYFPTVQDEVCLVHADFKPVNLLYHQGELFALDWEFAHAGVGIFDFAILLRHRDQFPLDLDVLVKGYTDHGGSLPHEWFRSALITDFVNILHLLEAPAERPKLFRQLISTLENTINS